MLGELAHEMLLEESRPLCSLWKPTGLLADSPAQKMDEDRLRCPADIVFVRYYHFK
jgi:hypothetical protein